MATLLITHLGAGSDFDNQDQGNIFLADFDITLVFGTPVTVIRPAGAIPLLVSLPKLVSANKISVAVTLSAEEASSGLALPTASVEPIDLDLGYADIAAIKAIAAADRADGNIAVNKTNSDIWVFAAASVAAGDDVTVLAPDAGTGRWLLAASTAGAPGFGAAGVSTASKGLVLDANKSTDLVQAKTSMSIGGTGVPGGAGVETHITKEVTAFTDTTPKTVFTVTIPNGAHEAVIELDFLGVLGAGGAIGAGEASRASKYQLVIARTAGVNAVGGLSAAIGGAAANVAGAANVTSVVATLAAVSGAVGATNTIDVQVAITKSGGASNNHTCAASARILNQNATGITIA